jgi:hypothetical protein
MEKEHLEIILEDIRGKFELVLEEHEVLRKEIQDTRQELGEKISLVDFKVDALSERVNGVESNLNRKIDSVESKLNQKIDSVEARLIHKIDGVADDLKAHRVDTEAHAPIYRVKE